MLTPRLTDCPACASIPSLLEDIECQLSVLAKRLYADVIFSLNQYVDPTVMFDLLTYKRILIYKYCNPEYAGHYTINMIASKVKLLATGCVKPCYTVTTIPDTTTTTTTCPPTTTSTTSTTTTTILRCYYQGGSIIITPTTTTTSTTTTILSGCSYQGGSITRGTTTSSTTTSTSSSTSTTSTSTSSTSTSSSTTSSSTSTSTTSTSTSSTTTSTSTTLPPCIPQSVVLVKATDLDYTTSDDAYTNRNCNKDYYVLTVDMIPIVNNTLFVDNCSRVYHGNYLRWIALTNSTCDGTWYTARVNDTGKMLEVISH